MNIFLRVYFYIFKNLKIKIKGKNNKIILNGSKIRKSTIKIEGNDNIIIFDKKCNIKNMNLYIDGVKNKIETQTIKIHGLNIEIKNNKNNLYIEEECQFWDADVYIAENCGKIKIGKNSHFFGTTVSCRENNNSILIGNNNLFSNTVIRNSDAHKIYKNKEIINKGKPVIIKNNIWLAMNTIVLKGVTINDGNVIEAGTIVTKDILENNCLIAGNPNIILKKEISWEK